MTEEVEETTQSITDQIRSSYISNRAARNRYEDSPNFAVDNAQEALREESVPIIEQEAHAIANNQKSMFDEFAEFGKHMGLGVAKAVEEGGQALSSLTGIKILEDNAWNIPEPDEIGDQIARGLGQFSTWFIPASGVFKIGLKMANLFQKSSKLTRAGEIVAAGAAGAVSDAFGFDPKDPNAANFALAIGVISKDSKVGAVVKEFLAQKDADPESIARLKAAVSGILSGAIVNELVRATGWVYKGIKRKRGKPDSELKEAADELAEDQVEVLDKVRQSGETDKIEELISKPLPSKEEAILQSNKRFKEDYKQGFESNEKLIPEMPEDIRKMLTKLANNEKIPDQDLDKILSFNLLKSGESHNMMNMIQYISKRIDVKIKAKPEIATEDFDVVIDDMIDDFIITTDDGKQEILKQLQLVVGNVRDSIPYIGTVKALSAVQTRKIAKLNTQFSKNPTRANKDLLDEAWQIEQALLFNGAGLSKATSDALRAHGKKIKAIESEDIIKKELQKRAISPANEVSIRAAAGSSKLERLDKIELEEFSAQTTGKQDVSLDLTGSVVEVTGKVSRIVKGKERGRKRKFKVHKLKETPTGKRVAAELTRLEKLKASMKRPERGAPFAKQRPLKDVASPEQLKEIEVSRAELKKIRQDRDTTLNKFKRNAKEQLRLRKRFEKLSDDIKKLQDDIDPRKVKDPKNKKATTVDIKKLEGERARLIAKLKPLDEVEKRVAILNTRLDKVIEKRLKQDFDKAPEIERTQIEKDIQKSIKFHQNKLKTAISEKEIREAFELKAQAAELADIDKMSFQQMRTRLAAMDRSYSAKTFRVWSEIYINGLLSSAKTILEVNPLGTTSAIISGVFERAFAALKTKITGKGDIDFKEVNILAWNYVAGIPDALRTLFKAMKHGPTDPHYKMDFMNVRDRAISKEAFNVGGNLGKAIDYLGNAVNLPGRLLLSTDEAFKSLINRSEQRALAYRKARHEIGKFETEVDKAAIQKRTKDIIDNIFEHEDVIEQARHAADVNTFTNILPDRLVKDEFGKEKLVPGVAKSLKQFIDQRDPTGVSRIFIPFFQTPANIYQFALDRTPLLNRISNTLKADLRSTNIGVRELAEARMASAYVIWAGLFGMAYAGNFTGAPPRDHRLRANLEAQMGGRHWWSVNFGDGWQNFNRFDPYGLMLTAAATIANMAKAMTNLQGQYERGDQSDAIEEKYNEVINAGVVGMAEMLKDRSYVQGITELMDLFSTDGRGLNRTAKRVAGFIDLRTSLFSSIRRNLTRGIDPVKPEKLQAIESEEGESLLGKRFYDISNSIGRVVQEANDQVMFGWGNRFAMKDLAGNVVQYPGVNQDLDITHNIVNSLLNPSPVLKQSTSPLINKLGELESTISQPSALNKVMGVTLTDEEKSFIIDKWTKRNQILNKTVKTKSFLSMPEGMQLLLLENIINENKKLATDEALGKFDRLIKGAADFKIYEMNTKTMPERPTGFQSLTNLGQGQ